MCHLCVVFDNWKTLCYEQVDNSRFCTCNCLWCNWCLLSPPINDFVSFHPILQDDISVATIWTDKGKTVCFLHSGHFDPEDFSVKQGVAGHVMRLTILKMKFEDFLVIISLIYYTWDMLRNFTLNHPSLKFWEICTEPDLNLLEYQSRQKQLTDQLK